MGAKEMGRVTCERERGGWQQRTKFGKQIRFTGVGARHQMPLINKKTFDPHKKY